MKVTVINQKCLDIGIQLNCEHCPISIAMKNNDYIEPIVGNKSIQYYHSRTGPETTTKKVSRKVSIRISRFDKGHVVQPFKIIEKEKIFDIYEGK